MLEQRLQSIERLLGRPLPQDYLDFLSGHRVGEEGRLAVPFRGQLWPIRALFELSGRSTTQQLDEVMRLVHDVVPQFMLPIGEDWAGNLFGLFVGGPNKGQIVWWDHERDRGDQSVVQVSDSFAQFLMSQVETSEDDD